MNTDTQEIRSRILCHRGYWASEKNLPGLQKNSLAAFERAIDHGYGIETDVRDYFGQLVIHHDVPQKENKPELLNFATFIKLRFQNLLALNVKSDGLIHLLQKYTERLSEIDHFFFDFSIPELLQYKKCGFSVASRLSEHESNESLATNIRWVDSFSENYWYQNNLHKLLNDPNLKLILVSPELHGFNPINLWGEISSIFRSNQNLFICTDLPDSFEKNIM